MRWPVLECRFIKLLTGSSTVVLGPSGCPLEEAMYGLLSSLLTEVAESAASLLSACSEDRPKANVGRHSGPRPEKAQHQQCR